MCITVEKLHFDQGNSNSILINVLFYCAVSSQSLPKSSWASRDQPTIIPQGVPFMVKLLRYYVSEDAVYLHLEHVQGELNTGSACQPCSMGDLADALT